MQTLPIDQLEQLALEEASKVSSHLSGYNNFAESMGQDAPAGAYEDPLGVDPTVIRAASEKLVSMGLLRMPTDKSNPEFKRALQAAADQSSPGLYDVIGNHDDCVEVIQGVANGTIGNAGSPGGELGI
jgi:hypothetical protein